MKLVLRRTEENGDRTLGTLWIVEEEGGAPTFACVTLELPWRNNANNVSRIPAGQYTARRRMSPVHGFPLFWIDDVPGRGAIEIHVGNFPRDTHGCPLLGENVSADRASIEHSKAAFNRFMAHLAAVDELPVDISDVESMTSGNAA